MIISYWVTITSPIVGVIAIIVSLSLSLKASKDGNDQIKAIHNYVDVFVIAQNISSLNWKSMLIS